MTTVTPSRPTSHATQYRGRLSPTGRTLFVVRWFRADGRDVRMRYFRRRHDAVTYSIRLESYGKTTSVFETSTDWRPVA